MCKKEDVCDTCKHNAEKITRNETAEGKAFDRMLERFEVLEKQVAALEAKIDTPFPRD
jgi:hypothetical protein